MDYDGYLNRYGHSAPKSALISPVSKSWLFEIVNIESGKIEVSFTLILPPTAISIKEPQRVSITKTFGNAFIDDYGADNIQITLKGISGTAHAFPTFSTSGGPSTFRVPTDVSPTSEGYVGRDAFYAFRDNIIRYKGVEHWDKKELRVYDLADEQGYKCILLDFTLDRQSGQPLNRYPFTISLFVYQRLEQYTPKLSVIDITKNPTTALNEIDTLLDTLKNLYRDIQSLMNQFYLMTAKVLELRTRINNVLTDAGRLLTSPLDIAKTLIDVTFATIGIAKDVYDAGAYTLERYATAEEMLLQTLNEGLKVYGYQISKGWLISKTLVLPGNDGIDVSSGTPEKREVDSSYVFSGLSVYTIKGEDTLQRIAQNELGDDTLWPYIAFVNDGITSNDDLESGMLLYIPTQAEISEGDTKESYIITEDVSRDPYGSDIQLDSDGKIIIQENSDFALISGVNNVIQAVNIRLNTTVGSMLKQSAFGITAGAGFAGTTMAISYLKLSLKATLSSDPRIEEITNIAVDLGKDTITIRMSIKLVGTESTLPVTALI